MTNEYWAVVRDETGELELDEIFLCQIDAELASPENPPVDISIKRVRIEVLED